MSSKRRIMLDLPRNRKDRSSDRSTKRDAVGGDLIGGGAASSQRPSVFSRLGTKTSGAANSSASKSSGNVCRPWTENGHCPFGLQCKFAASHTDENLALSSRRGDRQEPRERKDKDAPSATGKRKDAENRSRSRPKSCIGSRKNGSPVIDTNWESWNEQNLDHDDELMLERKRQLLKQELLQMSDADKVAVSAEKRPKPGSSEGFKGSKSTRKKPQSSSSSSSSSSSDSESSESSESKSSSESNDSDRGTTRRLGTSTSHKSERTLASSNPRRRSNTSSPEEKRRLKGKQAALGKGLKKAKSKRDNDGKPRVDAKKSVQKPSSKLSTRKDEQQRKMSKTPIRSAKPGRSGTSSSAADQPAKVVPIKKSSDRDKFGFYRASPPILPVQRKNDGQTKTGKPKGRRKRVGENSGSSRAVDKGGGRTSSSKVGSVGESANGRRFSRSPAVRSRPAARPRSLTPKFQPKAASQQPSRISGSSRPKRSLSSDRRLRKRDSHSPAPTNRDAGKRKRSFSRSPPPPAKRAHRSVSQNRAGSMGRDRDLRRGNAGSRRPFRTDEGRSGRTGRRVGGGQWSDDRHRSGDRRGKGAAEPTEKSRSRSDRRCSQTPSGRDAAEVDRRRDWTDGGGKRSAASPVRRKSSVAKSRSSFGNERGLTTGANSVKLEPRDELRGGRRGLRRSSSGRSGKQSRSRERLLPPRDSDGDPVEGFADSQLDAPNQDRSPRASRKPGRRDETASCERLPSKRSDSHSASPSERTPGHQAVTSMSFDSFDDVERKLPEPDCHPKGKSNLEEGAMLERDKIADASKEDGQVNGNAVGAAAAVAAAPAPAASLAEEFSDFGDSDDDLLSKTGTLLNVEGKGTEGEVAEEEGEMPVSRPDSPAAKKEGVRGDASAAAKSENAKSKDELLEGISDSELDVSDEEEARSKNTKFADALGMDWSQLCNMQKRCREMKTDAESKARSNAWTAVAIFNRIGLSKKHLGDCYDGFIKRIQETAQDGEKLELLHAVPGIHCGLKSLRKKREQLFSPSVGPYKRAISMREDIAIRRELCNLPDENYPLVANTSFTSGQ